jgi:hypothetical protein
MKIDLKRFEGRELDTEGSEKPETVWEAYGGNDTDSGHGWIIVAGVPIVVGAVCAAISLKAFLTFLAFAGAAVVLLGSAVIWIDNDTSPYV